MKLFMLQNSRGQFYKRRDKWVDDPQKATIWTTKQGAASSKGSCTFVGAMEIVEFEVELPEFIAA